MEQEKYSEMANFSDQDLDNIIDLLVEAREIMENHAIMKLVQKHAKHRAGKIATIQDLKDIYMEATMQSKLDEDTNATEKQKKA